MEFDEHGNPRLAEDAESVDRVAETDGEEQALDDDPETAYAAILADLREPVRETVTGTEAEHDTDEGTGGRPEESRESVGGA